MLFSRVYVSVVILSFVIVVTIVVVITITTVIPVNFLTNDSMYI